MVKYELKNSGIEWLEEIPKHWGVTSIKKEFQVIPSNVDKKIEDDEAEVKLCNYVDVYYNDFITSDIDFMVASASENEINKFQLKIGDVLITKDSEDPFDIAVPALVKETEEKLLCGYHLSIIRSINNRIEGSYLFWALKDEFIATQLWREACGVTRWAIASRHIKNSTIPFPPKPEQIAIANYLNKACTDIDRVVEIKRKQIRNLQNQLNSIIRVLVFNSDWKKYKVRYNTRMKNGVTMRNENLVDDGEFPVYGGNGIIGYTTDYNIDGETIIIGRVGAKCGNVHTIKNKAWISDNAIMVKTQFNYEFLSLIFEQMNLNSLASDTAQPLLTAENVKKQYVNIPDKLTQLEILDKVKLLNTNYNFLIVSVSKQIEVILNYKKSLIHEIVTGKKQINN